MSIEMDSIGNGYDYTNQSYVVSGHYIRCGHPEAMACDCYGRKHDGEPVLPIERMPKSWLLVNKYAKGH